MRITAGGRGFDHQNNQSDVRNPLFLLAHFHETPKTFMIMDAQFMIILCPSHMQTLYKIRTYYNIVSTDHPEHSLLSRSSICGG